VLGGLTIFQHRSRLATAAARATLALRGCSIDNEQFPPGGQAGGRRAGRLIVRNGQERRELEHGNWNCEVVQL
jgi:hypothetical protein